MARNNLQKINLSEDQQKKLAANLDTMITEAEEFHGAWEDLHELFLRQYLCKPDVETKLSPFPGASNLFVPLARVVQDGVMAQLHDAMFTNFPYMKLTGVESSDYGSAELLSQFYGEYVYKQVINLPSFGNQWNFGTCLDGTQAIKHRWDKTIEISRELKPRITPRYKKETVVVEGIEQDIEMLDGYDESYEEIVQGQPRNRPSVSVTDMSRIFISSDTVPSTDGSGGLQWPNCPWYYETFDLTKEELIYRKHYANYENVDEQLFATAERREVGMQEQTRREQEELGQNVPDDTVRMIEWYGRIKLPAEIRMSDGRMLSQTMDTEAGLAEEVIISYFPETRKIARIVPLWRVHSDGKRPHIINWYNQIPQSFYGQGIQSKMLHMNAAANSGWNQMVDAGHIANMPWFFYSPALTGLLPEIHGLIPGQGVPVNDPRGINFPRFQNDQTYWLNLLQQIQTYAERDGNVNDFTMGRNPDKGGVNKTARGAMMLMQQGAVAFGRLASLMILAYEEMFRAVHADYRRHAPDNLLFRVTNQNKISYKTLPRDVLGQEVDFQFVLNPNRQQLVQTFQILFQLMIGIPYIQQNPRAVRALAKQLYDATGTKNFTEVWPEEDIIRIEQQQAMQAQMMQQGPPQPGQQPTGGPPMPPQVQVPRPPMPPPQMGPDMATMMNGMGQMSQMGSMPEPPSRLDDSEIGANIQ